MPTTKGIQDYDAVVVGSGPNGLSAAITMKLAGLSVLVLEAKATLGGGMRSAELTRPGFVHDICSAIHPLAVSSPFFRSLPLDQHGLEFIYPTLSAAHPFDKVRRLPSTFRLTIQPNHSASISRSTKRCWNPWCSIGLPWLPTYWHPSTFRSIRSIWPSLA